MKLKGVRIAIAALVLSAAGLVGIAVDEEYRGEAYMPTVNDVPTVGYGSTDNVQMGDTTTPEKALKRLFQEVETKYGRAVRKCIHVPLTQGEFDAYVDLAYNIGPRAFCKSTLVKYANKKEYGKACSELHRWVYQSGEKLGGLVKRRERNYQTCTKGH